MVHCIAWHGAVCPASHHARGPCNVKPRTSYVEDDVAVLLCLLEHTNEVPNPLHLNSCCSYWSGTEYSSCSAYWIWVVPTKCVGHRLSGRSGWSWSGWLSGVYLTNHGWHSLLRASLAARLGKYMLLSNLVASGIFSSAFVWTRHHKIQTLADTDHCRCSRIFDMNMHISIPVRRTSCITARLHELWLTASLIW